MMRTVEEMLKVLSDEEIAEIGKELGCDYSYTTWKEAKVMIIEDYVDYVDSLNNQFAKRRK